MIVYFASRNNADLIQQPKKVSDFLKLDSEKIYQKDIIYCPAITNFYKNVYAVYPTYDYELSYNGFVFNSQMYNQQFFNDNVVERNKTKDYGFCSYLDPNIMFFTEEKSLEMEILPSCNHFSDNKTLFLMSKYDIGKHLRKLELPLVLKTNDVFKVKRNAPLYYVRFKTEKTISFKRFIVNEELDYLIASVLKMRDFTVKFHTLEFFYNIIEEYKLKKMFIKLIKQNVID